MIDIVALCAWTTAVPTELGFEFVPGPREPEYGQGDLVGVITPLEGPGLVLEGAGDRSSFQVKLVSREFQANELQRAAFAIDQALVFGDYPAELWGTQVQFVTRTGGQPSVIQEDEHDRVAYVCSYIAHETPEL